MVLINIIPEGAKTPEGVARINKAVKAAEDANGWCADLLRMLFDCGAIDTEEARQNGVEEALQARTDASQELIQAVCGRPPR